MSSRLLTLLGYALVSLLLVFGCERPQTPPYRPETLIYSVRGADLFAAYCAVCHGPNGMGDGPMASNLKVKVPDLTLLTRKNKGRFPSTSVSRMIAVDEIMLSHGSREMPI